MNTRTRLQEIPRHEPTALEASPAPRADVTAMLFTVHGPCRMPAPVPVPVPITLPGTAPQQGGRVASAWLAAFAAAALLSAAAPSHAAQRDLVADGRIVEVGIRVEGHRSPLFIKPGDRHRWYFEAFQGQNYSLVLRNTTGRRVGVLIAVDGLNVVSGKKSSLKSTEPMYVLGPWGSAEIAGWRTSLKDVRKFVFVDEEVSYASRTGQANGDMGWIRVLAFQEQRPWNDTPELRFDGQPRSQESPAPNAAGPEALDRRAQSFHGAPESAPGTGWGQRDYDPVRRTDFLAARTATDHLVLRYEYASGLRALGIFPPRRHRVFERDLGHLGFAKPPLW
jgi:hypothetical protein